MWRQDKFNLETNHQSTMANFCQQIPGNTKAVRPPSHRIRIGELNFGHHIVSDEMSFGHQNSHHHGDLCRSTETTTSDTCSLNVKDASVESSTSDSEISTEQRFPPEILRLATKRIREGQLRKSSVLLRWKGGKLKKWDELRLPGKSPPTSSRRTLLHFYLTNLIQEQSELRVQEIKKMSLEDSDLAELEREISRVRTRASYWKSRVDKEFSILHQLIAGVPDIPRVLCDKITGELLQDPVITPEGLTYERTSIQKHLIENGPHDPFTKTRLSLRQLTPNVALKSAVKGFIQEHEWAIGFPTSYITNSDDDSQ